MLAAHASVLHRACTLRCSVLKGPSPLVTSTRALRTQNKAMPAGTALADTDKDGAFKRQTSVWRDQISAAGRFKPEGQCMTDAWVFAPLMPAHRLSPCVCYAVTWAVTDAILACVRPCDARLLAPCASLGARSWSVPPVRELGLSLGLQDARRTVPQGRAAQTRPRSKAHCGHAQIAPAQRRTGRRTALCHPPVCLRKVWDHGTSSALRYAPLPQR